MYLLDDERDFQYLVCGGAVSMTHACRGRLLPLMTRRARGKCMQVKIFPGRKAVLSIYSCCRPLYSPRLSRRGGSHFVPNPLEGTRLPILFDDVGEQVNGMVSVCFQHFCCNLADTRTSVVVELFEGQYDLFLCDGIDIAAGASIGNFGR